MAIQRFWGLALILSHSVASTSFFGSLSRRVKSAAHSMVAVDYEWKGKTLLDGTEEGKYAHDEITYRIRSGEVLHIPQAERYSTADWIHNLRTLPSSRLLKRIKGVVSINFMWSCIVLFAYKYVKFRSPGSRCHSLLGSALGLLLVFRTNTAYTRFWEGRRIWERILNILRDSGRMIVIYSDVIRAEKLERMLHLLCAFPIILQEHVQGFRTPGLTEEFLTEADRADIDRVTNRPLFILGKLAYEVRTINECNSFTSRERQMMFKYLDDLCSMIGSCERIVQTPVPLTYARHTSRFLSLFLLSMPIALVAELGSFVVPFVTFSAWSLFGIQEIGMMIEEPFQRALKLEVFANTIRRDISDLLHVSRVSPIPLNIESAALGYEVPFSCRVEAVNKLLDEKALTPAQVVIEIERLRRRDSSRLRGNDPMQVSI